MKSPRSSLYLALLFAAPRLSQAWMTMSIASGLPIRRSVAKFTADPLPDGAVSAAVEGKYLVDSIFEEIIDLSLTLKKLSHHTSPPSRKYGS